MRRKLRRLHSGEGGAAAVEFALVLPILIFLIFLIIEVGRLYNMQISLTGAAREGARWMAIYDDEPGAKTATIAAAPSVPLTEAEVTVTPTDCTAGSTVTITVTYTVDLISGYMPAPDPPLVLTGTGVMLCGG
ncbi:TadE/TadG family type IV pilus assembly protein [Cryobacterium sp. Y11]|uniref:TadE/TadG family type IV pilus assembly protein n=1 Tax=Cryobacterium sp. Y11 TaxID=2045016 RepID=UPI001E4C9E1D|nr:TadE/TadG family type IV pilus assembly protein [Cryobacterium sp. Y11]